MITIFVKKLDPRATIPTIAHPSEDAAFDLHCLEGFTMFPNKAEKIRTGIACEFPAGYWAHMLGRSGLAAKGVAVLGGVIDSGYRGEWFVQLMWNHHLPSQTLSFIAGDKIAQVVLQMIPDFQMKETNALSNNSARGTKGFGSSDVPKNAPYVAMRVG